MDHFAGLDVSVKETKVCQWQILALKTSEGWQRMSAIEGVRRTSREQHEMAAKVHPAGSGTRAYFLR
jgi:hypothetical protein